MVRFSKAILAKYIVDHIKPGWLSPEGDDDEKLKFNPDHGWAQVEGKGEDVNRAYGSFRALLDLAEEFGLDLNAEPPKPKPPRKKRISERLSNDMRTLRGYGQTEGYMKAIHDAGRERRGK